MTTLDLLRVISRLLHATVDEADRMIAEQVKPSPKSVYKLHENVEPDELAAEQAKRFLRNARMRP